MCHTKPRGEIEYTSSVVVPLLPRIAYVHTAWHTMRRELKLNEVGVEVE